MSTINQEKETYWRAQLALAEEHNGSMESFCRTHGLSVSTFSYWRSKFRKKEKRSKAVVPAAFIPVELMKPAVSSGLPDPRWLAEFILALSGDHR